MNPAIISPDFEQRVRDRAYAIWESEGRPFGRHIEHWRVSLEAMLAEQAEPVAVVKPAKAPARKKAAPARRAAPAAMATAH